MARDLDESLGELARRWVASVRRYPRAVSGLCLASLLVLAPVVALRLGLNSDEEALFAESSSYAAPRADFKRAFPNLVDPIVVVVDAPSPDLAQEAADELEARLSRDPAHFPGVLPSGQQMI